VVAGRVGLPDVDRGALQRLAGGGVYGSSAMSNGPLLLGREGADACCDGAVEGGGAEHVRRSEQDGADTGAKDRLQGLAAPMVVDWIDMTRLLAVGERLMPAGDQAAASPT
jgi:hypothetical protein